VDYVGREREFRCPLCGKEFTTRKGLCIHMHRSHSHEDFLTYPNEGISVSHKGSVVELRITMRKTLWEDIIKRVSEDELDVKDFLFDVLTNVAAFGRDYSLYINEKTRQTKVGYIS